MRQRRLFVVGMLFAVVSFAVHAQSPTVSNVTALDTPPDTRQEPVVIVQPYAGGERAVAAYMKTPQPLIYTSWTVPSGSMSWSTPQPPPLASDVPFDKSGDPVLIGNDAGAIYLAGVTFHQSKCGTNQISLWTSTNGGQSWSNPLRVARNNAGSGLFTDKPAALVSKFSRTPGRIYVAYSNAECNGFGPNTLTVHAVDPNSGASWFLSTVATGQISNPQIFEDQWGGMLYLAYQDFTAGRVVIMRSNDLGMSWSLATYVDTSFPLEACTERDPSPDPRQPGPRRCIATYLGLTGRFTNYVLALAWHRSIGDGATEAVISFYNPSNQWFPSAPQAVSSPGHYSFYPTVEYDGYGFYVTFYDYDRAASPSTLVTTLRSSVFAWNGSFYAKVAGSERTLDGTSGPYTAPSSTVGEYQGLYYRLGFFYAVTMFRTGSRDDVHHVRFTPY